MCKKKKQRFMDVVKVQKVVAIPKGKKRCVFDFNGDGIEQLKCKF